jgi:hypothetical protein
MDRTERHNLKLLLRRAGLFLVVVTESIDIPQISLSQSENRHETDLNFVVSSDDINYYFHLPVELVHPLRREALEDGPRYEYDGFMGRSSFTHPYYGVEKDARLYWVAKYVHGLTALLRGDIDLGILKELVQDTVNKLPEDWFQERYMPRNIDTRD